MLLSICMCTYKRSHLRSTLDSIANLNLPSKANLEVIVVDNDINMSGKSICDEFIDLLEFPLIYLSEPLKNISAARNKGINEASGDWIAFIDDDEIADPNWLKEMYRAALEHNATGVFGRVISVYPENTPNWIVEGRFFDRRVLETGTEVSSGACGSAMVDGNFIRRENINFDLEYGLSGGEDADFFHRIHLAGGKLIASKESLVSEEIEQNRLNLKFLINRKLRIGQSFTKYRYQEFSFTKPKLKYILLTSAKLVLYSFLVLINCLSKPSVRNSHILKLVDAYGKLSFFVFKNTKNLY